MILLNADKSCLKVCQQNMFMAGLFAEEVITSGSVNVYTVKFNFSSDWDGLDKTVVFRTPATSRSVLLDNTDECNIPWEVLVKHGYILEVGVYGTKGKEIILPTVWASLGTIQEGAEPAENTQEPTPTMYQMLDAARKDALDAAAQAQANADKAAQLAADMAVLVEQVFQDVATASQAKENALTAQSKAETAQSAAEVARQAAEDAANSTGANVEAAIDAAARAEDAASQSAAVLADLQTLYQQMQDYVAQAIQAIQEEGDNQLDCVIVAGTAQTAAAKAEADRAATEAENAGASAMAAKTAQKGAEDAMSNAQNYALHPPVIGEDGMWYLWDGTKYAATDKSSSGLPYYVEIQDVGESYNLPLVNNVEYRFASAMTELAIDWFEPGEEGRSELWSIVFTAGKTITVTVPDEVIWAVAEPVFTPGSTYWISVVPLGEKYLAVWTEVEADAQAAI